MGGKGTTKLKKHGGILEPEQHARTHNNLSQT